MALCGKHTFFLESVYTRSASHDATFLSGDIRHVFAKYDFIDLVAVVTNNTSANQSAWLTLQDSLLTCFSTAMCRTLVKDVMSFLKWLEKLVAGCKDVVVFFKKMMWYKLKIKAATPEIKAPPSLAIPCDTRWGSILACLQSVLKPEKILLQLVTERGFLAAPSKAKKAGRRAVFDFVTGKELVVQREKAAKLLEPLVKFQGRFEKNRAVASEVFEMVLVLPDQIAK
ncbi:hypothetical protein PR003_g908 [Phytophthora rubi]|uniref:DUF659 domain-containing protein n=2 Tax=Phytophthora rubi TaxID=129364 RepID=A0A6A3P642_9STRA|nr:hypothetical protein PR001_g600 [Phytophthora rubi]KAE9359143.1 hypothetical protein PR003_g908 [Phytophthora rubi]